MASRVKGMSLYLPAEYKERECRAFAIEFTKRINSHLGSDRLTPLEFAEMEDGRIMIEIADAEVDASLYVLWHPTETKVDIEIQNFLQGPQDVTHIIANITREVE